MSDTPDRNQFLNFAGVVEGGLALLALGLAWTFSVEPHPLDRLAWNGPAFAFGVLATAPLFLTFILVYWLPVPACRTIRKFLSAELAPSLARLTWFDLILLAVLAGFSEELLFRGVLEPWIGRAWSNVLFGFAHLVTPLYGLLTLIVGYYLSWLMTLPSEGHLVTPMVTHALHDYLAFLVIVWLHRREQNAESE